MRLRGAVIPRRHQGDVLRDRRSTVHVRLPIGRAHDLLHAVQALQCNTSRSQLSLGWSANWRQAGTAPHLPLRAVSVSGSLFEKSVWPGVELRGLEPLASCMPCLTNPSGIVRGGQVPAGQSTPAVR
jgi:hypothetical protein